MATYTTNLNLKKPAQSDKIRIADINNNMDDIDAAFGAIGNDSVATQIGNIQDAVAIVAVGDSHAAITAGWFVYVRSHETLDAGLYVASSNIAENGALSLSNLTPDPSGGLNALNSKITPIDGHLKSANLLYTFGGTSQQSVTLAASAQNYYFVMALLLNGANTVIGTAFVNPVIANNRNVQIFGSDSSTWGSFMLTDNGTKCTFNRTSATTQSILLYGISLTLDN